MSRKKKIILISAAVTLVLAMTVGGLAYAINGDHENVGGHKLIGVGEMGNTTSFSGNPAVLRYIWDTEFIITNPNCERELEIEWVSLVRSDESVILEGPPGYLDLPSVLSGHQTIQISIAEIVSEVCPDYESPEIAMMQSDLDKYTLEVTWDGVYWWYLYSGKARPLAGWQKEKCLLMIGEEDLSMAISEAEMRLFTSRIPLQGRDSYEWCPPTPPK